MIAIKLVFRVLKVMNSETSASSLAAAFALGAFLALVPIWSLQGLLLLGVVLFLRVNLTAALLTFALARLARPLFEGALHELGALLLESAALRGLWTWVTNHPLLSFADLGHTTTLGGTVTGLVAFLPMWRLGRRAVLVYRDRVEERLLDSRLFRWVRGLKVYTLYRTATAPFT